MVELEFPVFHGPDIEGPNTVLRIRFVRRPWMNCLTTPGSTTGFTSFGPSKGLAMLGHTSPSLLSEVKSLSARMPGWLPDENGATVGWSKSRSSLNESHTTI